MGTRILITLLRLFSSCPGIFKISGKVISDQTEAPLEGAQIELFNSPASVKLDSSGNVDKQSFLSDKNGDFTASSIMKKMIFGLPKYQIRITKSGYKILEIKINLEDKNVLNLYKLVEN